MVVDYRVQNNQSIYDIANINLGGFDNLYSGLILLNSSITSINFDLKTIASQNIQYESTYYKVPTLQLQINASITSNLFTIKGKSNQSIYDLALMNYGSLDNIFDLIQNNGLVSINDQSVGLIDITFDKNKVLNSFLTSTINKKGYSFGTFINSEIIVWDGLFDIWDGTSDLVY